MDFTMVKLVIWLHSS